MTLRNSEATLLLLAHAGDERDLPRACAISSQGIRWVQVLEASKVTRGTAALAWLVGESRIDVGQFAAPLQEEAARVAAQASLTAHTAALAQGRLEAAGVRSLVVKGVAFLAHDPGHLSRRHLDDVDLLVRPEDLPAAAAALTAGGFSADDLLPDYAGAALDGAVARPVLHRTANFLGPGDTLVEVHTALPACRGPEATLEALLSRAVRVRHGAGAVTVAGLDDTLGLLCRHVMVQHAAAADHLPRHVADVAALLRAGADPAVARARFDDDGRPSVDRSVALVEAARRGEGPAARAWSPLWAPLDRLRVRLVEYAGAAGAGPLAMLLPSRRYMAQRYGVPPGSARLPLLYLWRPLRGVVKLLLGR